MISGINNNYNFNYGMNFNDINSHIRAAKEDKSVADAEMRVIEQNTETTLSRQAADEYRAEFIASFKNELSSTANIMRAKLGV